jgi:hypothetical protein
MKCKDKILLVVSAMLLGCGASGPSPGEVLAVGAEVTDKGTEGDIGICDGGPDDIDLRVAIQGADLVLRTLSACGEQPRDRVSVTLIGRVYCITRDGDDGFEVEECNEHEAKTDSRGELRIPLLGPVFDNWGYAQIFAVVDCEGCDRTNVILPPELGAAFLAQNVGMDSSQWKYQYEQWLDVHPGHSSKGVVKSALQKLCSDLNDRYGEGGPEAVTCYRDPDYPWECDQEMYEESLGWDCGMFLDWRKWFDEPYGLGN